MAKALFAAAGLLLTFAAGPVLAQSTAPAPQPGDPNPPPSTQDLNAGVNAGLQNQQALNAANQAIYDANSAADEARYDQAMQAHAREVHRAAAADAHYRRQQRAYSDAMSVWRVQVRDCLAGHKGACNAPPPDPADFY